MGRGELLYTSAVTLSHCSRLGVHFGYSVSVEEVICSAEIVKSVEKNSYS